MSWRILNDIIIHVAAFMRDMYMYVLAEHVGWTRLWSAALDQSRAWGPRIRGE